MLRSELASIKDHVYEVIRANNGALVRSKSDRMAWHRVSNGTCDCEWAQHRDTPCAHVLAVGILDRQSAAPVPGRPEQSQMAMMPDPTPVPIPDKLLATAAQVNAIFAIARRNWHWKDEDTDEFCVAKYSHRVIGLSKREASALIDRMKAVPDIPPWD